MRTVVAYGMRTRPTAAIDVVPWREVAAFLLGALLALSVATADLSGRVVKVHDGDTPTVLVGREQVRVRLLDIDAPESKQPLGARSRQSIRLGSGAHARDRKLAKRDVHVQSQCLQVCRNLIGPKFERVWVPAGISEFQSLLQFVFRVLSNYGKRLQNLQEVIFLHSA